MDRFTQFGVPDNFNKLLPDLKAKSLKWEAVCYSGTEINNSAKIHYYSASVLYPLGDLILSPGLGTNTDIDPLMKMLTYWGLTHKYNIMTIDTFLGDFLNLPSLEVAQKNTYHEFISSLESSIKFIEPYSLKHKNILIGHSAGATGVIDALNSMTIKNEKINLFSVMLFAPWASAQWGKAFKEIVYQRCESSNFNNPNKILPVTNMFNNHIGYMNIMPQFITDKDNMPFRPDLMNNWGTYTTIIAGEYDKKAKPEDLQKKFDELKKQPNHSRFRFIVLPKAKHSFLSIYKNNQCAISLIQSQKEFMNKKR